MRWAGRCGFFPPSRHPLSCRAADPSQRIPALTLGMDVLSQLHLYAAFGQGMLYVTSANASML